MSRPDHWHVGVIYSDSSYGVHSNAGEVDGRTVEEVVFPVYRPWSEQADLYPALFELVGSDERNMGSEDRYRARVEDTDPDGNHWSVSLEYVEYMDPIVNELEYNGNISYANWDTDDLLDAISDRF